MRYPTDVLAAGVQNQLVADPSAIETRPIRSEDRDALARLFTELSPRSRYRRFLSIKAELAPRELDWLTAVDHVTHEAIAAVDARDGSLVGVCRYVLDQERPGVAELAIVVVDAWQGMRIGAELAAQIVQRARDNGMATVSAHTLASNPPIHALLRSLGFCPVRRPGRGSELNWELVLTPLRAVPRGEQ